MKFFQSFTKKLLESENSIDFSNIPYHLVDFLFDSWKKRTRKTGSYDELKKEFEGDILARHNAEEKDINKEMKLQPANLPMYKKSLEFIDSQKLYWIYPYGNGDSAWYSIKDKKIYDWNHELGAFNALLKNHKENYVSRLSDDVDYQTWMDEVDKGLRVYAWKKTD